MAGCQDMVHKRSYARSLSVYKETPSKQGESLWPLFSHHRGKSNCSILFCMYGLQLVKVNDPALSVQSGMKLDSFRLNKLQHAICRSQKNLG